MPAREDMTGTSLLHCCVDRVRCLMLPTNLTKRLVNHARPQDVTEGYAADWTMEQLRESAQRIADRIDELIGADVAGPETLRSAA